MIPVLLHRPTERRQFKFPDEAFFVRLHQDEILGVEGRNLLEEYGTSLEEVEKAIRAITKMIAMPFSPQKSQAIREAEVSDILKRTVMLTKEHYALKASDAFPALDRKSVLLEKIA